MEGRKLSVSERNGYIKKFTDIGYNKDVMELALNDLEYGLEYEDVERYLDKKWDLRQKKVYSMCLRAEIGEEIIAVIMRDGLDGSQMQVALEFYQKGVPISTIEEVIGKGENAKHMQLAFEGVLSNLEATKESSRSASAVDREYVDNLVKQIETVVEKIQFQEARYDELNKKLAVFETAQADKQVHDNLLKKYNDSEAALNSQQEEITKANATIARLRDDIDDKKKEMERMQNRINTLEDKLVDMASAKGADTTPKQQEEATEKAPEKETVVKSDVKESGNTQTFFDEKPLSQGSYQIPVFYQLPVVDANGRVVQHVQVERTVRKGNQGAIAGFLGKLGFMKKSRQDIVKLLASGDLVPAQLVQIRCAIEKGLTEAQLVELINNNVSAEKMKEIIDIAVLENSMDY